VLTEEAKEAADHFEVLRGMQSDVGAQLALLGDVERMWQPTDFLPDLACENWREEVQAFRDGAMTIDDDLLVVLVGDMVTEEALPSYAVALNRIAQDEMGDAQEPWAKWLRGWTAEENRHGDLLGAYLRLTGRVDMRSVERTVQRLIAGGFNPRAHPDPYNGLVYTSFQERATKISHQNVGRMAGVSGDVNLARICQRIAGDESRHETFYTRMMARVFEIDPEGGVNSFRHMMRGLIAMPGKRMDDGKDPDLFEHFAGVAQRLGVYTVHDYAAIIEHLVSTWKVGDLCLTGRAAKAQDYLCRQAERYTRLGEEIAARTVAQPRVAFAWIHGREA
jgi:acyl-[acyl-carrier-protein] desaturase